MGITFVIKEGPKVKVGKIKFEGNKNVKTRILRYAMKNLRPIGIPHSIFLENIFARTYDATKLDEDTERVRNEYQNRGYFKVIVNEPKTEIHDTGHKGIHIPLLQGGAGKAVDITMPIEEGDRYTLGGITFKNNKAVHQCRRRCEPSSPSKTAISSAKKKSPRVWRTCARPMANWATSTSPQFPKPGSTTTRN